MKLKVIATGSKGNAYVLESATDSLLIECGVNITEIKKSLGFDLSRVSGCLVTHEHKDHCASIMGVLSSGIGVWATEGTHRDCQTLSHYRAKVVRSRESFPVGSFRIKAFDVKHDAAEPVGFVIDHSESGRVLFLTDTYFCRYTFPGLNNIIIEANYSKEIIDAKYGPESGKQFLRDRILQSHFSLDNCIGLLKANDLTKVNNIVLIHLSDSNSDENTFVSDVRNATGKNTLAARAGMEIELNKQPF